jgi:DNA-binding response OmpR family regulator
VEGATTPRFGQTVTLLVVDDNPDILASVGSYFEDRGFVVVTSSSALGVSSLVIRHKPRVCVLDAMMPALDGGALAKLLRGIGSAHDMGIVFYSSMDEEQLYQLARSTPGASYVLKSDGLGALYAAVCAAAGEVRG